MYVGRRNRDFGGKMVTESETFFRDLCLLWHMFSDFKYPEKRQISPKRNLLCKNTEVKPKKRLEFVKKQGKSKILTKWFEAQGKKPPKRHGTTRSRSQGLVGIPRPLLLFFLGGFAPLMALKSGLKH